MTTFQSQQSDRGRCVHQKADATVLQIHVTKCASKLHGHRHEAQKSCVTILKEERKSASWNCSFMQNKPYPFVTEGFCGSLKSRRWRRGVPRDGHVMTAKQPTRQPAKFLAANPNHVPAMAGQWQRQCRRMPGKATRKTACSAPHMDARCPRRKLARQPATRSRNSRATDRATIKATSRKTTPSISPMTFKNYEHTS